MKLILINIDQQIEISSFSNLKLLTNMDRHKQQLSSMGITIPDIQNFIWTSQYAFILPGTFETRDCLLTNTAKIKGKRRIILIHLQQDKELSLETILAFDYEKFQDLYTNPPALFLKALDYYGGDIELNGIVKKLHPNGEVVRKSLTGITELFKIIFLHDEFTVIANRESLQITAVSKSTDNKKITNLITVFKFRGNQLSVKLDFVYSLDIGSYIKEFARGEI